uniref:Antizyme inhibitor 1b n=1 Tax=Neogobius melanostomus TaxID=47308 RepID=A0A8C6TQV7_9GOBI
MKGLADNPSYIIELMEDGVTLEDVVDGHIYEQALAEKNAFVVADLGSLMRQHVCWQTIVPHLQPYFPVKSNSNPLVIEVLASLGLGFVCANKAEVNLVLENGVPPENIILSGVCKQLAQIKHAAKNNIQHLVCENETELSKISRFHPLQSKLLVQLTTEAHAAETSMAFGSSLKSCRHLLEAAKKLGVQVVGVTFHIPSSCQDLQEAYTHALSDARCVFDMAVSILVQHGHPGHWWGFTGSECQLKLVESAIRPLLDAYFPPLSGVQVLAEPGGFYVASAFSLAVNIIGKKFEVELLNYLCDPIHFFPDGNNDNTEFLYYMNEGVYGPFSQKLLGNTIAHKKVSFKVDRSICFSVSLQPVGPSLDQLDQVVERCLLPEVFVGTGSSSPTWGLLDWTTAPARQAPLSCLCTTQCLSQTGQYARVNIFNLFFSFSTWVKDRGGQTNYSSGFPPKCLCIWLHPSFQLFLQSSQSPLRKSSPIA